ncbi:phospholipase D-like domain-containing protein [Streptomyces sp. NPDC006368]|uniref:phospholipase D-like domain-containing protein n=1 Tax=Streptomyces sp. NPDC006368 TaxID=3156760 RepID=UPI0033A0B6B8
MHRHHPRTWLLGLVVALLSALAAPTPAAAAVTTGVIFNDPAGTTAEQDRIRDHLVSLIDGAPAGSSVRLAMYTFTDNDVRDALIAAKGRGVAVKVIVDYKSHEFAPGGGTETPGGEYENLAEALGTDRTQPSWILSCPRGRGCIANRVLYSGEDGSINHNKFALFSSTGGTSNVVLQTSANMSGIQRTDLFNNAVTIVDKGLYDNYLAYFNDQVTYSSTAGTDTYYKTPISATNPAYKNYFFPRKEASGLTYRTDPGTDTVKLILDKVDCAAHSEVRIAANLFNRTHVASKLVAMVNAGCSVTLAADADPDGGKPGSGQPSMHPDVEAILYGKLTQRVECWENPPSGRTDKIGLHSKYLLVNGTYDGVAGKKIVWTGSHNYTWQALRNNDETLLKIDNAALHDLFKANHDELMSYCAGT